MKICSICQRQYNDDVIYCLDDGTPLFASSPYNSEEMTVLRPKKDTRTNTLIYSLIGIIVMLVIALAGFFLWKQGETKDEKSQTNLTATNNDYDLKKKELDLREKELEMQKQKSENQQKTQPPIEKLPPPISEKPLPPPIVRGTKYSGSIGSSSAVFNLSWNKNKTVTGSYYFSNNPSQGYTLSGTNYTDGEIELQEYGNMNARIKMFKSIKGNTLCWNGSYYANNGVSTINFCRYR